ncbi:hypothetical protein GTY80_30670 [Amycolatopsis sp. SID8362]|nr:hypothetical protein [Amycolatopsis sp. SID8362]NED44279.1 hypothetical protein [Amycolatopsis sp. SID8362]
MGARGVPARILRVSTLGAGESGAPAGAARHPVAVTLPATATSAGFEFDDGSGADLVVTDGMALAWLPRKAAMEPGAKVRVRAWNAKDELVYDGSLTLF